MEVIQGARRRRMVDRMVDRMAERTLAAVLPQGAAAEVLGLAAVVASLRVIPETHRGRAEFHTRRQALARVPRE
jgi:hypothetical protein